MKKRRFLILAISSVLALAAPMWSSTIIHAEEIAPTYTSNVKIGTLKNGDIIADVLEGNVGDKVTLKVSPYVLYKTETIKVNGTDLVANEEGNYEFLLVEGENLITATFVVNNEELTKVAEVLSQVKDEGFDSLLTLDNLFSFLYLGLSTILSSGFFITLLRTKKIKASTANEISAAVKTITESSAKEVFEEFLKKTMGPTFETWIAKFDNIEDVMKTLSRCFVLSQENTPEARLAIIEELTKLQNGTDKISKEVRKIINAEIEKNNAEKKELENKIEQLKKENENIIKEESESDGNDYGQM